MCKKMSDDVHHQTGGHVIGGKRRTKINVVVIHSRRYCAPPPREKDSKRKERNQSIVHFAKAFTYLVRYVPLTLDGNIRNFSNVTWRPNTPCIPDQRGMWYPLKVAWKTIRAHRAARHRGDQVTRVHIIWYKIWCMILLQNKYIKCVCVLFVLSNFYFLPVDVQ